MKNMQHFYLSLSLFLTGGLIHAQTLDEAQGFVGTYEIEEVCAIAPAGDAEFFEENIFEDNGHFILRIEAELNEGNNLKISVVDVLGPCSLPQNLRAASISSRQFQIKETIICSFDSALNQYIMGTGILSPNDKLEMEYRLLVANSCDAAVCRSNGKKISVPNSPIEKINPDKINVYFDNHRNTIVFDGLQETNLQFELYDISGRCLSKAHIDGSPLLISELPHGIYPYRLLKNNKILQTGKIRR